MALMLYKALIVKKQTIHNDLAIACTNLQQHAERILPQMHMIHSTTAAYTPIMALHIR